jgi:hypothetical protein
MQKLLTLLVVLVVLSATAWFAANSLTKPAKRVINKVQSTGTPSPPAPVTVAAASTPPQKPLSMPILPEPVPPSPLPPAKISSPLSPEPKAPLSTPSPALVASSAKPALPNEPVLPVIQQAQTNSQSYDNGKSANFEPTTLTVIRTFVLKLPGGSQIVHSVTIPVLFRKGSIALLPDQITQLATLKSEIKRIRDAYEELRIASDMLISRQHKLLAGSVPVEVLSPNSPSVLPEGNNTAGINYLNLPQANVEIAPARTK